MVEPNGKQVSMLLKLPEDSHRRLKQVAIRERRTLHAQTILALEEWTEQRERELAEAEGAKT